MIFRGVISDPGFAGVTGFRSFYEVIKVEESSKTTIKSDRKKPAQIDLKILRMTRLHIPQERMANRLGVKQQTISIHLQKMPELAKLVNTDLLKGFTSPRWLKSMVGQGLSSGR